MKAVISGVTYNQDQILSCRVYSQLYEGAFKIGTAPSAQVDLSLLNPGEIPRGAKIELYEGEDPQGIFLIYNRQENEDGTLDIHGYDYMLKTEQTWLTPDYDNVVFPMSEDSAVNDICQRIGVERDPSLVLNNLFEINYPVGENGDLTMREVLCGIAGANAGSFVISLSGKLKLIKVSDAPEDTNYLTDESGYAILFGEVLLVV